LTVAVEGQTCARTGIVTVEEPCALACEASAAPASGPAPLTVTFAATATASHCAGEPSYTWDFGDGFTSAQQSPSHAYSSAGSYTWFLTVAVDGKSCWKTGTVSVAEPCIVICEASASPTSGSAPLAVAFAASATASNCSAQPTYSWAFGDGGASAEQNPNHTYAGAGTFFWSLSVSADGVTCTHSGTVTVEPGLPGDANGDGVVSVGEVQQAINMFLGTQPPGNGVDCNGDGVVSVGEVQKVINAFLGMASSC
jgi:PKD repeat protein